MPVLAWRTRQPLAPVQLPQYCVRAPRQPRTEAVLDGCTRGCSAAHLMANAVLFNHELEGTVRQPQGQPRKSEHETRSISPV